MTFFLAGRLIETQGTVLDSSARNAEIESFTIQVRQLIDFYWGEQPQTESKRDAFAADYFDAGEWARLRPERPEILSAVENVDHSKLTAGFVFGMATMAETFLDRFRDAGPQWRSRAKSRASRALRYARIRPVSAGQIGSSDALDEARRQSERPATKSAAMPASVAKSATTGRTFVLVSTVSRKPLRHEDQRGRLPHRRVDRHPARLEHAHGFAVFLAHRARVGTRADGSGARIAPGVTDRHDLARRRAADLPRQRPPGLRRQARPILERGERAVVVGPAGREVIEQAKRSTQGDAIGFDPHGRHRGRPPLAPRLDGRADQRRRGLGLGIAGEIVRSLFAGRVRHAGPSRLRRRL
jgi:hypothetical protein